MTIGTNGASAEVSPAVLIPMTRNTRYYSDFETYLIALLGFAYVAEASRDGHAASYRMNDSVRFDCKQTGARWYWRPEPSATLLSKNIAPSELYLTRITHPQPPATAVLALGAIETLMYNFGQALATNYFERLRPTVEAQYGDVSGWPPVWNFARVVRNAMSHGGTINFQNSNSQAVSWRGLTYSPADNGRTILHTDLWPGDIFELIVEMDAAIQ
jgi:hypothetical protein